jgi:hypothetical protein
MKHGVVRSHLYGLAVMKTDGTLHEADDSRYEFAIESISKIITMAFVIEELGATSSAPKSAPIPPGSLQFGHRTRVVRRSSTVATCQCRRNGDGEPRAGG